MEHKAPQLSSNNTDMKRLACLAVVGLMYACSLADYSAIAKEWVVAGLTDLRAQDSIYLDLAGTVTTNGNAVNIRTIFLYQKKVEDDGRILEKLECVDYTGSTATQRIVADGINLWCYDPATNSYSATRYGSYTATSAPANYTRNLMQAFMSAAKGRSMYIARLMLDAKAGASVNYTPWMPAAYADVVNGDPTKVRYLDGNPSKKIITYLISPDGAGGGKMTYLGYWDNAVSNNRQKVTDWGATISPVSKIDASHFTFTPPAGAHGSSNSK